ncbi:TRAP transporter TatT component family protein [Planctomycetota bacterium]
MIKTRQWGWIQKACAQHPLAGARILLVSIAVVMGVFGTGGCSIKKMAINSLADALSESGSVYASDNDPELIRQALPFSLKLIEGLLAESPENRNLLLAAASGFTQYAYAFVQEDADRLEVDDIAASDRVRLRARNLYLRARDYGLRGLAAKYPGIIEALQKDPSTALKKTTAKDMPFLYWTAAAWAGAINVSRDQPDLIAELPQVDALIDRAMALEPDFSDGALYTFMIAYEFARTQSEEEAIAKARLHFERAVALSQGQQVSPYLALAEAVSVTEQNREEFVQLLQKALAIDPDLQPETRLANIIGQIRAQWLMEQIDELFWDAPNNG